MSSVLRDDTAGCVFDTCLPKRRRFNIFERARVILAVDCDSVADRDRALRFIHNVLGYQTYVVASSPDHFWIFTDYVGKPVQVVDLMRTIPGADSNHITSSRYADGPIFRAWPKTATLAYPAFPKLPATFSKDDRVLKWLSAFQEYYKGDFYRELVSEKARKDEETQAQSIAVVAPPQPVKPEPVKHKKYDVNADF